MERAPKEQYAPTHSRSEHSLDGSEEDSIPFLHPESRPSASASRCGRRYVLLGVVLLVLSNVLSLLIGGFVGRKSVNLDRSCAAHTTQYCRCPGSQDGGEGLLTMLPAPVLKDVDIEYSFVQFNGSFMQEEVYRKAGSPEVDAAWEALGVDCEPPLTPTSTSTSYCTADDVKTGPESSPLRTAPTAAWGADTSSAPTSTAAATL